MNYDVEARADAYRERLLDRHLSSERSDSEEDACFDAWVEHLADFCETCEWAERDGKPHLVGLQPCGDCADNPPEPWSDWCQHWHDDREREAKEAWAEARAADILDGWD